MRYILRNESPDGKSVGKIRGRYRLRREGLAALHRAFLRGLVRIVLEDSESTATWNPESLGWVLSISAPLTPPTGQQLIQGPHVQNPRTIQL